MPTLQLMPRRGAASLSCEVDLDTTTVLELRWLLFSLTDIVPESVVFYVAQREIGPEDDVAAALTLRAAGVVDGAPVLFADILAIEKEAADREAAEKEGGIGMQELQAALAACANRKGEGSVAVGDIDEESKAFLKTVRGYWAAVLDYEDGELQARARKVIPEARIRGLAAERLATDDNFATFEKALAKELLIWFKDEFFTWVNFPKCWSCGGDINCFKMTQPGPAESEFKASRVELYSCEKCGAQSRFPRYNDAGKLLETRKGRCGEWAQAFTLCARAVGLRARAVHDWTDHVWTEIWVPGTPGSAEGRWLHADSCENILDEPLLYEVGWKKKGLKYMIATGADSVMDVTRRYTKEYDQLATRRTLVNEAFLDSELRRMNAEAVSRLPSTAQRAALARYEQDAQAMGVPQRSDNQAALPGRQSGSEGWVQARGEDGQND